MDLPSASDATMSSLLAVKNGHDFKLKKRINDILAYNIKARSIISEEKHRRSVTFNSSKYRMNLWKGPVHRHRLADQLIFPLSNNEIEQFNSETVRENKTSQAIFHNSTSAKACQDLYKTVFKKLPTRDPTEANKQLTLEEQKKLALQLASKANVAQRERLKHETITRKLARQKKIKSKSFHKHQKQRMMKEYEKETELLRTTNPALFAERMKEAEKNRIKERISQKHRLGSKFIKMKKLQAAYSQEARDAISAMYEKHEDLMKDVTENYVDLYLSSSDDESIKSENEDSTDFEDSDDMQESQKLKTAEWWRKAENKRPEESKSKLILSSLQVEQTLDSAKPVNQNDNPIVGSSIADKMAELCSADIDNDVMETDFASEKAKIAEEEAPKDLDTFLPGWNSWTGPGTEEQDEAKRKKRLIKAPERKRRDTNKAKVIIREKVNEAMKKHLVKTIPFPYNTPEQFEAVLKQPLGREWNSETSHRQLIKPRIVVQKGKVIQPLDSSATFLQDKEVERLRKNTLLIDK